MTDTVFREPPDLHDESAGIPAAFAGSRALPTIATPGYAYFTDYKGNKWLGCVCIVEFLELAQKVALKRGLLKQGFDIWQLTGGATASAGTHTQGGAFDLLFQTSDAWVKFFRDLGATATWRRTVSQGFSKEHLHGVLNGCVHNSPARYQVTEQKSGPPTGGGDGLTGTKPDYHPDPNPYRTWAQGRDVMKKELGLMALATTTTLTLGGQPMSMGSYVQTSAVTSQPGTAYAQGTHVYDYLPTGSTTWREFKRIAVVNGKTSFLHNYGNDQAIRVRFIPKDAGVSKPSSSAAIRPQVVNVAQLPVLEARVQDLSASVASLQSQVSTLTAANTVLKTENASLKAQLESGGSNPPKPVPALGFDVSGWQTPQQVQALVADAKNEFAIAKATQRADFTSSQWPAQRDLLGSKFIGTYHYAEPPRDPVAEAKWYIQKIGTGPGLPCYDVEAFFDLVNGQWVERDYKRYPLSATEKAQLAQTTLTWLRYVKENLREPVVYTNWDWLKMLREGFTVQQWEEFCDDYTLWLAQVANPGQWTSISPKAGSSKTPKVILHQYAYFEDSFGKQIDRDWTPDINDLRKRAGL
jgi:GH25 family lysozyme M1 (1,4-beta-N-acetylmuramidase)